MSTGPVSVHDAVTHGLKTIASPSANIVIASVALPILLLALGASWWVIFLLPAGIIFSSVYANQAVAKWQLWAYEHVHDIHQLQRSAEMAKLLARGSHERVSNLLSADEQGRLRALQEKFGQEPAFIDDPAIPGRTAVFYANGPATEENAVLALNSAGIWTDTDGFFDWDQVTNERIPMVKYSRLQTLGNRAKEGTQYVFRFDHANGYCELPLSAVRIAAWELDLLLYIYRGRFMSGQIPAGATLPQIG